MLDDARSLYVAGEDDGCCAKTVFCVDAPGPAAAEDDAAFFAASRARAFSLAEGPLRSSDIDLNLLDDDCCVFFAPCSPEGLLTLLLPPSPNDLLPLNWLGVLLLLLLLDDDGVFVAPGDLLPLDDDDRALFALALAASAV